MSDAPRRLTTEEQRQRVYMAKRRGGLCGICSRVLGDGEPVYVEQVEVSLKPFTGQSAWQSRETVHWDMPVGAECASPEFLRQMEAQEPERCITCDRPMYYGVARRTRRRALCSKRCRPLWVRQSPRPRRSVESPAIYNIERADEPPWVDAAREDV